MIHGQECCLFDGNIEPNDIQQGSLGTCYFLSALSSLAERPNDVRALFYNQEINSAGIYLVYFYLNGKRTAVIIDDHLPVDKDDNLSFSYSKKPEIWVSLLEKAWSKVNGSF